MRWPDGEGERDFSRSHCTVMYAEGGGGGEERKRVYYYE